MAMELFARSANFGYSMAHNNLAGGGGGLGPRQAGHEVARYNLGCMEDHSGNMERALKHWTIAASAGCYTAMYHLMTLVKKGYVSKESSTQLWQLTIIPALR